MYVGSISNPYQSNPFAIWVYLTEQSPHLVLRVYNKDICSKLEAGFTHPRLSFDGNSAIPHLKSPYGRIISSNKSPWLYILTPYLKISWSRGIRATLRYNTCYNTFQQIWKRLAISYRFLIWYRLIFPIPSRVTSCGMRQLLHCQWRNPEEYGQL